MTTMRSQKNVPSLCLEGLASLLIFSIFKIENFKLICILQQKILKAEIIEVDLFDILIKLKEDLYSWIA
jgi:hypothetical protein